MRIRAFDRNEARQLCALLAARCESRRCHEHIFACRRARDLRRVQRHLASAFVIAEKEGAVTAADWRRWKRRLGRQRYLSKLLNQGDIVRKPLLDSELGVLVTERFRIPPQLPTAKLP